MDPRSTSGDRSLASALQREVEDRSIWFHECHLRGWNIESFRAGASRFYESDGKPLDDLPSWSEEERMQRNAFEKEFIGKTADWLRYRRPAALIDKLAQAKKRFLDSLHSIEPTPDAAANPYRASWDDGLAHAMSRIELTERKPWLIPELFGWSANHFVDFEESEIKELYPAAADSADPLDFKPKTRIFGKAAVVSFLEDDRKTWIIKVGTGSQELVPVADYPRSEKAKYWLTRIDGKESRTLRSLYMVTENSDMGLTHIMRLLYRYGTIPDHFPAQKITWRPRRFDAAQLKLLYEFRDAEVGRAPNEDRKQEIGRGFDRLARALARNAENPLTCDIRFSLLAEEVIKRVLLRFKFWLDEPFRVLDSGLLTAARKASAPDEKSYAEGLEMQYWSENHYIMLASGEYLAGQLWETDLFQPGVDFLTPAQDDLGRMTGERRKARGKHRVLKYLNNRLAFGWTEFNSGGYYREHYEAIVNLAEFALDHEVRQKALMVLDLLLFDIARFSHKGALGAAGGRVQVKAKRSGWDQGIGDLNELAFGTRGAFNDSSSDVGAIFASSTYKVPDVLLEIGAHPPAEPFVDRSRVSITFDEAFKYGIGFSQTSRQRRSHEEGYRDRIARYWPHVAAVNTGIEHSHPGYGKREDDLVFWWTLSAFFPKQTIDDTMAMVERWGLAKTKPFEALSKLFGTAFGAAIAGKLALYGLAAVLGPVYAAIALAKIGNPFSTETHADDLSLFVEGSIRTRANIYTYRSRDVMLSSVQNFRQGQLNYQTNVNQATLSGSLAAFVTAPFEGVKIPDLWAGVAGGLALAPFGMAVVGSAAAIGGTRLLTADEDDLTGIIDHDDGPGWWTGYWALPLVVQYRSAAILQFDFHWLQRQLSKCATHLWLPESGLTQLDDNVDHDPAKFDDSDTPLGGIEDAITDAVFGKNGVWLFGRVVHREATPDAEAEEAYIGVFANWRWEEQDQDSDFYKALVDKHVTKPAEDLQNEIDDILDKLEDNDRVGYTGRQVIERIVDRYLKNNLTKGEVRADLEQSRAAMIHKHLNQIVQIYDLHLRLREHNRVWPKLFADYFADKDRYVKGKNIWIMQVGSRAEFGSYELFKFRVTSSSLEVDTGDLETTWDIPEKNGSTSLRSYFEDHKFEVGGHAYDVDHYPRFENPFVRGGLVEWGQRDYTIEYRGSILTHGFRRFEDPRRIDGGDPVDADSDRIRGLAVYIRTENENMDIFSVARATVTINCVRVVTDDVIAVGEVGEDTTHDVEWIYFDGPEALHADMGIEISHPPVGETGNSDPHWRMSFRIKALTTDNRLLDCNVPLYMSPLSVVTGQDLVADYGPSKVYRQNVQLNFEDDRRSSGLITVSVPTNRWREWEPKGDLPELGRVAFGAQGPGYFPHVHIGCIDADGRVLVRKLRHCDPVDSIWSALDTHRRFQTDATLLVVEPQADYVLVFVSDGKTLQAIWKSGGEDWSGRKWQPLPVVFPPPFGIGNPTVIAVLPRAYLDVDLSAASSGELTILVEGPDGALVEGAWTPGVSEPVWTMIPRPAGMLRVFGQPLTCVSGVLFATDVAGRVWAGARRPQPDGSFRREWDEITPPLETFVVSRVAALAGVEVDLALRKLFAVSIAGEVWCADYFVGSFGTAWQRLGVIEDFRVDEGAVLRAASSALHRVHVSVADVRGRIFVKEWTPADGWDRGGWALLTGEGDLPAGQRDRVWLVSRTRGTLEVFAETAARALWWRWWS